MAFFPPTPGYAIQPHPQRKSQLQFIALNEEGSSYSKQFDCFLLKTPKISGYGGQDIVAIYMQHQEAKLTLLYSHGNATDLGYQVPFLRRLQSAVKCNIMCYDYTGYGRSSNVKPMVNHTLADIQACYDCLVNEYKVEPKRIVLYGESLGSGPAIWLASKTPQIAGVVLHAPLMSGLKVLAPGASWWPTFLDVFPNDRLIKKIKVPIQVMHGELDEVISCQHGKTLQQLAPNATGTPLFLPQAGHNNLPAFQEYFQTVWKFLKQVEKEQQLQ
eukprot:TRINITY_DN14096_c1_g1_i2.p1 TRINITY_DN14096_c1_g1~~TRINITY_DN14096_c1_g1_i2.p1  ORF type:complete len:315 (-),score=26.21 TRINITY_DN14096_c1_g1_i2:259-1074(-)